MPSQSSTRREFLTTASAAAASAMLPVSAPGAERQNTTRWAIGCHTRPFGSFRASQANNPDYVLDAIKAAGYKYADMISAGGGGGRNAAPAATPGAAGAPAPQGRGAPATAEAVARLKQALDARGLKSIDHQLADAAEWGSVADAIANARG